MKFNKKPENMETIQHDNIIVGFVADMAIIQTEDKELHYIEGMEPEHGEVGEVVPDGTFKSIRLLPAKEQAKILEAIQGG